MYIRLEHSIHNENKREKNEIVNTAQKLQAQRMWYTEVYMDEWTEAYL